MGERPYGADQHRERGHGDIVVELHDHDDVLLAEAEEILVQRAADGLDRRAGQRFAILRMRYPILIVYGESLAGKTMFANGLFREPLEMVKAAGQL